MLQPRPFMPGSRRCGVLAVKCGMTQEWDSWGVRLPLTVLWIDNCEVRLLHTSASCLSAMHHLALRLLFAHAGFAGCSGQDTGKGGVQCPAAWVWCKEG